MRQITNSSCTCEPHDWGETASYVEVSYSYFDELWLVYVKNKDGCINKEFLENGSLSWGKTKEDAMKDALRYSIKVYPLFKEVRWNIKTQQWEGDNKKPLPIIVGKERISNEHIR